MFNGEFRPVVFRAGNAIRLAIPVQSASPRQTAAGAIGRMHAPGNLAPSLQQRDDRTYQARHRDMIASLTGKVFRRAYLSAILAASIAAAAPAAAADADFYSGKSITLLIGFSAGGGYDIYARTLARHMARHLPGNARLVPQNMPGAGSLKAVNYLYNVAPRDGTVIGAFAPGTVLEPLLGRSEGAQFDAPNFTWLGSISREVSVCAFIKSAGIRSWDDMRSKKYVIGASGGGAESDVFPNVLRKLFHLPLRIVTGYPGGTEIILAMERREVDGRCGWSWTSLLSRSRALLDSGQIYVTLQIGLQKDRALSDVPLIMDLTNDPAKRAALRLIVS